MFAVHPAMVSDSAIVRIKPVPGPTFDVQQQGKTPIMMVYDGNDNHPTH
jgi:hypothetical protein